METQRLVLRQVRPSDLETYHTRLTSDPDVAKYMLWEANSDISHTAGTIERIRRGYADGTRYHWAIALKEDDSLIGTIALLGFEADQCSFAYMLGKDFWGQGYGTEALQRVFRFAFEEMELSAICADHFADNPASGAVMKKAGMRCLDLHPGKYEKNGIRQDAVLYTITKEDWKPGL